MRTIAAALLLFAAALPAAAQPWKKVPPCDLRNFDTTVAGITLGDTASTKKVLGEDYRTVVDDPQSDYQWLIFASRDNKQLFLMRQHAGDLLHSYQEFEVKFGRHDKKPMKLPTYEFITGKGIRLGMKRKPVIAKLGSCFRSTRTGDTEIVRYLFEDKTGGTEGYYAEYEFRNGVLMRFKFGHEPV